LLDSEQTTPRQLGHLDSQLLRPEFANISKGGGVLKFVAHSRRVLDIARRHGWNPGARYTNLRDIRHVVFEGCGFLDIDWKRYSFDAHLKAAMQTKPLITVARDIVDVFKIDQTLREAEQLEKYANYVIVVPKDKRLAKTMRRLIPDRYILGYSVPTKYGGTEIAPTFFDRPVHLLGGRPDSQRRLAEQMPVVSVDCNRFTLDAGFGDYFDGQRFKPHPVGGYEVCLADSIRNIESLWHDYAAPSGALMARG
jgi:hypothetical protein